MIINHNIPALNSQNQLSINSIGQTKTAEKLASGLRVNRAGDDAAGLAVSEKMRAQIRGLNMATRNVQDGVSFIQTTEGYLQAMENVVHRLRELSIQSANGIYTSEDRHYIQVEVNQLVDEVDRIASQAHFNTQYMLTGRFTSGDVSGTGMAASMWIHMGANMDERERIYIRTMSAKAMGLRDTGTSAIISISTIEKANRSIAVYDEAIKRLNTQRADLGAYQNRMESAIRQLTVASENFQASESRIRDTDFAAESTRLATFNILTQSATAMLAQANAAPALALRLLQ